MCTHPQIDKSVSFIFVNSMSGAIVHTHTDTHAHARTQCICSIHIRYWMDLTSFSNPIVLASFFIASTHYCRRFDVTAVILHSLTKATAHENSTQVWWFLLFCTQTSCDILIMKMDLQFKYNPSIQLENPRTAFKIRKKYAHGKMAKGEWLMPIMWTILHNSFNFHIVPYNYQHEI